MDWHATAFTAQVSLLRSTMRPLDPKIRGAMEDLQFDVSNANEDEPDDPLMVCSWTWHNGVVGDKEMTFTAFLALFTPALVNSRLVEHEGLIIRMHHLPAPTADGLGARAIASSFLTTMQHGHETPATRVWGTIAADEEVISKELADRLICMERLMTAKAETVAQVLKLTDRR